MTDEHQITILSLHGFIKRKAKEIIEKLKAADLDNKYFQIELHCEGRSDGELKIEYKFYMESEWVTANSLEAAVEERLRRFGWKKTHAPISLPKSEIDDIPF